MIEPAKTGKRDAYPAEVIAGCKQGDRACLGRVFRGEAPYVERVLLRIVGSSPDVEDLLQASLEQAIRAFPRFRGEASVRTWLTRIAVRTAMHHLKSPAQKRRASLQLVEGGEHQTADARAFEKTDARNRLRLLHEHLSELDPKQHTAFVLFQVEGRSMDEVAALMDSSLSATKSRVMWARRKLLARLAKDPRAKGLYPEGEEGGDDEQQL